MLQSKLPAELRADCSRCVGLCCVEPAFYAVQGFGYDKPAHVPCRHLTHDARCAIHEQRIERGFAACVGFDCLGAGQRVTKALRADANWRASKEAAARAFAAYRACVVLHRLMAMLTLAERSVARETRARLRSKRMQLDRLCRSDSIGDRGVDTPRLESETLALVRECLQVAAPR
jgi:hypothetical protein